MHLYERRPIFRWRGVVLTLVVFFAIIALFAALFTRTGRTADREQAMLLKNAIASAAVSGYATDGRYPATLDEITENYGIIIDSERFYVDYDIFAPNVVPSITVTVLKPAR